MRSRSAVALATASRRPASERSLVLTAPLLPSRRETIDRVTSSTSPEVVISLRAKRVCEDVCARSSTSRSPSLRSARTRSIVFFASSRPRGMGRSLRPDDVDAAEPAGRTAVAHRVDLAGLPLAVPVQADVPPGRPVPQEIAGLPQIEHAALVGNVGHHRTDLTGL